MHAPSFDDVLAARPDVYAHMAPSPLQRYAALDEWLGCRAWVKHENCNPTGAFKIRGGLHLVARLDPDERQRGVISASTGNHGQSLALACQRHGVRCRIVVPAVNNPRKRAAIQALGAEIVEHGRDFDEAREYAEALAAREGWRYVHSANEPRLIAGVGTYAVEIFEALPAPDLVFVPIGGGSGASACAIVRDGLGAQTRIVGVQAARADAFARSWREGQRISLERADTFAEGIATRTTYDLTFGILQAALDEVMTVEEDDIHDAAAAAMTLTGHAAEGAAAAALAAARRFSAPAHATVVCVMSGGNAEERRPSPPGPSAA
jgi:threonine dehydratase